MSANAQKWVALIPEVREQVASIITTCGHERTAQVIAAGLTAEQQPHAMTIADAFERALDWHAPQERIGTAFTDAHRVGQGPAEVAHRGCER